MNVKKVGLLLPGQGACYAGVLQRAAGIYPEVEGVFADVDAVAAQRLGSTVTSTLWSEPSKSLEELMAEAPDLLQLAIYGTSVAVYRVLTTQGLRPDLLIGHSFGEIAAMVCAGAFSVTEGAEIVCERTEASRLVAADGYMAALATSRSAASTLIELLGNHDVVVAGENSDTQTVLSGIGSKMDSAAAIARILGVPFIRLNSPYPFHSPLMEPVRVDFRRRLQRFAPKPLAVPVFSPILGRYYEPADSLTDSLASHLVRPVAFAPAVRALYADGVRVLVECGALDSLTKLATRVLKSPDLTAVACLVRDGDDAAALTRALDALRTNGLAARPAPVATMPAPSGLRTAEADEFWAENAIVIREFVDATYARFRARRGDIDTALQGSGRIDHVATPARDRLTEVPPVEVAAVASASSRSNQHLPPRDTVFREVVSMYAAALEYPIEVFTEDVELEAELGIDSVKQTELLARVAETYRLPPRPPEFRLADYHTMRRVVDFVLDAAARGASPEPLPGPSPLRQAAPDGRHTATTRADLFRELVSMYAEALEYPVEVFTENVHLEAELGIDSVKQTELLARAAERYSLPPRPADFRLANYGTMGKVVDFIHTALSDRPETHTDALPA